MSAERPLQLLTALLMSLGSVMLGVSSGNVTLPLLTITASATSIYLTDRLRWFYLHIMHHPLQPDSFHLCHHIFIYSEKKL